jgi:hypothetical protein
MPHVTHHDPRSALAALRAAADAHAPQAATARRPLARPKVRPAARAPYRSAEACGCSAHPHASNPGKPATPTRVQFNAYEQMFAYFNRTLFGGELPPVILNFSRKTRTYGFFAPERWQKDGEVKDEISLNPAWLTRPALEVSSTLVHEMCHLWQWHFGTPSRRGYHNAEWASKMDSVGLVPSTTGAPGGKRVGQAVSHYVDGEGRFMRAFAKMPPAYKLPWAAEELDGPAKKVAKAKNKSKFTCPSCGANAWGKPELAIRCVDCDVDFEPVG